MTEHAWNPGMLMETSGAYWKSCVIHTGVKLGIFTTMEDESISGKEICERIHGSPRGVLPLLNALVAMGLLEKEGEQFKNTPFALTHLSRHSPDYIGHIIMHHHHLMSSWQHLDEAVISGSPSLQREGPRKEEELESFLLGMYNNATFVAPDVARCVDLSNCATLLDLGGGPGTFAIHFCEANPQLKAWVYDLPATQPFAEKTIARHHMDERILFQPFDFMENSYEDKTQFDAAWLSHILHSMGDEEVKGVISRTVSALHPGGKLLIHEFLLDQGLDGPLFPALFSLNMLAVTKTGRSYSDHELASFMASAGLTSIRRINYGSSKGAAVMEGIKA